MFDQLFGHPIAQPTLRTKLIITLLLPFLTSHTEKKSHGSIRSIKHVGWQHPTTKHVGWVAFVDLTFTSASPKYVDMYCDLRDNKQKLSDHQGKVILTEKASTLSDFSPLTPELHLGKNTSVRFQWHPRLAIWVGGTIWPEKYQEAPPAKYIFPQGHSWNSHYQRQNRKPLLKCTQVLAYNGSV